MHIIKQYYGEGELLFVLCDIPRAHSSLPGDGNPDPEDRAHCFGLYLTSSLRITPQVTSTTRSYVQTPCPRDGQIINSLYIPGTTGGTGTNHDGYLQSNHHCLSQSHSILCQTPYLCLNRPQHRHIQLHWLLPRDQQ